MDNCSVAQVLEKTHYLLLLTSTHGDGDIPQGGQKCGNYLKESSTYLGHVRYSLFGLGDERFDNFCGAAKKFEGLLNDRGASNILQAIHKSTEGNY
jgi:sulfite reductase alpha subunit-like flavoprotein